MIRVLLVLALVAGCGGDVTVLDVAGRTPPFGDVVLRQGLQAWRTPTPRGACAGCHAPDASDLARFAFTPDDLRRRARFYGLAAPLADDIVALVAHRRTALGITTPWDPLTYRPFQPGGTALPGATPAERDAAFLDELRRRNLRLAAPARLTSAADAEAAARGLVELDPRTLRVGFDMPRWSEDPARGEAHRSLVDWLPDVASRPRPEREAELYALHDAYLQARTAANLWRLVEAAPAMTWSAGELDDQGLPRQFFLAKYRTMLIAAHLLGEGRYAYPDPSTLDPLAASRQDLELETRTRTVRLSVANGLSWSARMLGFSNRDLTTLPMPLSSATTPVDSRPAMERDLVRLGARIAWLQMVWDPAQHASLLERDLVDALEAVDRSTSVEREPNAIHRAFAYALTVVNTREARDTRYFFTDPPRFERNGDWGYIPGCELVPPTTMDPADPRWEGYRRLVGNTIRLIVLRRHAHVERTRRVLPRDRWIGCVSSWRESLARYESPEERADMDAVFTELSQKLAGAADGAETVERAAAQSTAVPIRTIGDAVPVPLGP